MTVTDPEDPSISCNDIQVKFVLGHDTHGHELISRTGCRGFLPTDANDASHGGNVFGVVQAVYTDKGSAGGVPPLTGTSQIQTRQKHQEVEHVVTQSGTNTATNTDGGAGVHRGGLGNNDWMQLNGPFNLFQIDSVTFRVADVPPRAWPSRGRRLAAGGDRGPHGLADRPIVTTREPRLDRQHAAGMVWSSQTFPISLAGKHELFFVFRSVTGGATGGNLFNLNWAEFGGNGVTVVKTDRAGRRRRHACRRRWRSRSARRPRSARSRRAWRGPTTRSMTANVISSAGDAALSVADPSPNATGRLVNGAFSLPDAGGGPGGQRGRHGRRVRPGRRLRRARPRCSTTRPRCPTTP